MRAKFSVLFIFAAFFSFAYAEELTFQPFYNPSATECPKPDTLNRYLAVDVFPDLKATAHIENIPGLQLHEDLRVQTQNLKFDVYYELHKPYDPSQEILILVPGGPGGDHEILHDFEKKMQQHPGIFDRYNVIAMDHRGLGCSQARFPWNFPIQAYKMRFAAADIEAIRVALGGSDAKINLWGGSYGTMLGQTYALLYPDHLNHLILRSAFSSVQDWIEADANFVSLATQGDSKTFQALAATSPVVATKFLDYAQSAMYSYFGRTEKIPTMLRQIYPLVLKGEEKQALALIPELPWVMEPMTRAIICQEIFTVPADDNQYHQFHQQFQACKEFAPFFDHFDYSPYLKNIKSRTLLIVGAYDHVTPLSAMRRIAERIPDNYLYVDPVLGHAISEKPECYEQLVLAYLNDGDKSALDAVTQSTACTALPVKH